MFRLLATTLRASAIAIPALLATSIAIPAAAQFSVSIGYDDFHSRLAPYGTWSNHPRWGEVWHPTRVERNFRPYYNGRWEDTREYGWTWVSDESWGDIPYHYGRWVSDPREGWLWVPGYVWGPSWVVWRSGGGNIGWFPMPPGDNYYGDGAYRDNYDNQYGYRDWYGPNFSSDQFLALWIFVGQDHFRDRDFRNYALPQRDYGRFIAQTTNTTNYITINNYVVNRSIDDNRLQRETNQRFQPVAASSVIGSTALVTQASAGRQVEQRERQKRPIPVNINPVEQRSNLNSPALQRNLNQAPLNQTPQDTQRPGGNRNQRGNDAGQADPKTDRTAPVANLPRQNGNQAPQNAQERRGNRNQGGNDAGQGNPQTERATAAPVAPVAPVANTPRQNGNQAPQDAQERTGNRNQGANDVAPSNPQTERSTAAPVAPLANAPRQNGNQAPQDAQERRGNGNSDGNRAGQANPRAERGAAADRATTANPATQATPPAPVANTVPAEPNTGPAERRNRGPVPRDASAQNGKVIVQDAPTPPRVQGNNQVRGNRQGDANNADERKAADEKKAAAEKKKADAERGPN